MVYFIRSADGSRIKIGTTKKLAQRLYSLASEYREPLEVMAIIDGSFETERELHQRFAHLNIENEWFEPGTTWLSSSRLMAENGPLLTTNRCQR